jgi:hypothetical protein
MEELPGKRIGQWTFYQRQKCSISMSRRTKRVPRLRGACGNLKQFSTPWHFSGWTASLSPALIVELVVEPVETRSFPTSVCRNACTASRCVRNEKWMYNGDYLLWFTISARSTPLGRSSDPRRSKTSVKPSAMREIGISINHGTGKALENMLFRQSR